MGPIIPPGLPPGHIPPGHDDGGGDDGGDEAPLRAPLREALREYLAADQAYDDHFEHGPDPAATHAAIRRHEKQADQLRDRLTAAKLRLIGLVMGLIEDTDAEGRPWLPITLFINGVAITVLQDPAAGEPSPILAITPRSRVIRFD